MFRRRADEHLIDEGHVYCPVRQRDVEFDLCAGCRWMTGIDLKSRTPVVRCKPELTPAWIMQPWR